MKRLPDAILLVHWAWLLLMLASPWLLPWYLISLMSGIVLALNAWNDMHCPVTEWEFDLRRKASEQFIEIDPAELEAGTLWLRSNPAGGAKGPYTCYYVVEVADNGATVQEYLPAEAAIDRGLALLGITLSPRAQTMLTLLVLLGAPLLAYLRKG